MVFIGYDNEESRNNAIKTETGSLFMNQKLRVSVYYTQLYDRKQLISLKLKHPNIHINVLQNCNNYWNEEIYPEDIIDDALKNGTAQIMVGCGRFNIIYHHRDIGGL